MNDLISVIVPVYNVERYLEKCIRSILEQSYSEFELLLINDGSTDKSREICEELSKLDDRIRLYHKSNGGLSDARNYGLNRIRGQYVAFIDSDDYVHENYLKDLYCNIKKHDAMVSICSFVLVGEDGRQIDIEQFDSNTQVILGLDLLERVLTSNGYKYVVAWNKLYKSILFDDLRFDKGKLYEDEFINFRIFYNSFKVAVVHTPLYYYLQRKGSIIKSSMTMEKLEMSIELHKKRLQFYQEKSNQKLYSMASQQYCNWIISTVEKFEYLLSESLIEQLQKDFRLYMPRTLILAKERGFLILCQNILGKINIRLAARIKKLVRRGS